MSELSLKRINGRYFIYMEGQLIHIYEEEAGVIMADHSRVYDIVVAKKRKFHFNTAEDRPDNLYHSLHDGK